MGNRIEQLHEALFQLEHDGILITAKSAVYETEAWGLKDQPAFLNQALEVETSLSPRQLLRHALRIEKKMGRIREVKFGPRVIDIDLLLYNDEIHRYPLLTLPHPELINRRFALTALSEIAPEKTHPVEKKTISELLRLCQDPLAVTRLQKT